MNKYVLLVFLVLLLPFVSAKAEVEVDVSCPNNICRVNEPFYMIYNITLPNNECCGGVGLEHQNGTKYFCAFEDVGQPVGTEYINQICSLEINETGVYKVFKGENLEISYLSLVRIRHALPDALSVTLLVLMLVFLLISIMFNPVFYIVTLLLLIGALTSLIFQYSYILSPILIGVIALIFIGLLLLIEKIFHELWS